MPPKRNPLRTYFRALAPVALLFFLATTALTVWLVRRTVYPQSPGYLVTPDGFRELDARGLKVTNETWDTEDGMKARGWLLRGDAGAPAVLMLHSYDTDRSWLLNLGVTLNAVTNYTVLWADARGHGPNPPIKWTSFGTQEAEDAASALKFLRSLTDESGQPFVNPNSIGIYGLEMGGYAGLFAAAQQENAGVRTLVLDSVPETPEYILQKSLTRHIGSDNGAFRFLARLGAKIYLRRQYVDTPFCTAAGKLMNRNILLLAGPEEPNLRATTGKLQRCLPTQNQIVKRDDLSHTGFSLPYLPGTQGDAYNQLVISFFKDTLTNPELSPRFRFPATR